MYKKCYIWETNDNSRRRHFFFSYRQVMWIMSSIVQQYRWWCMCPWNLREETKDWSLVSKDFISFTIYLEPASILKTPCSIASPCLFESASWKQLNAMCIESKSLIWLWIFMVLSLVLGLGSLMKKE